MTENRDVTKLVDMDNIVAQQEGEPVQLYQVSGKGAERTFRVLPLQRALIGRAETATVCIEEAGVSRQHALIEHQEGVPRVVDLGSTNGTFVNGQKIDAATLKSGDRVQVGSAVLDVTVGKEKTKKKKTKGGTDPKVRQEIAQIHQQLQGQPTGSGQMVLQTTILAGNLENIGLPSLLQTLEANNNSGSLMIHLEDGAGHIYLKKGQPKHAKYGRTRGKKALFRLMTNSSGRFELLVPGFEPDHPTIQGQLEGIMLAAVTEIDEFTEYRKELPSDDTALEFSPNRTFILDKMPPDLFEVLATISRHQTVGAVIDECNLSDLSVCRNLLMLLNEKIITQKES